jgi:hypothetical protein
MTPKNKIFVSDITLNLSHFVQSALSATGETLSKLIVAIG